MYESRNLQLLGSFGQVVNDREGEETRRVRRASASAFWRPTRFLNLRASYRDDKRMTSFLPDLDGTSAQAWATLHIGLFDVSAGVSQWTNDLNGETATTRRNYLWTISRRFGGILPISTGTRRMGVIR